MIIQELNKKFLTISNNLAARRLKPAFDLIGELISENSLGEFLDEYRNLEKTYHYMLQYTLEGISDPERQKVYLKLIVSVYSLADQVYESIRIRISSSIEYEKKRVFRDQFIPELIPYIDELEDFYLQNGSTLTEEEIKPADTLRVMQEKIRRLFYHVWFTDQITSVEGEALRTFFLSPVIIVPYKSFLITALLLSLQRFFDIEKFNILFDAYDNGEPEVNQRALVSLLINLYNYNKRLPFHPGITGRLKILNENDRFKKNIERIIVQFIRSKNTEKLQQRIRDEILPEMIKISPTLKDKINLDSLMEEGFSEDKNPDWEEIFKDSPGLLNKMEEFSELQMEGADVFMGSFAMLKSFPFYNEVSNWFMPFFPENPEISGTFDLSDPVNMQMIKAVDMAPILCNSDKYSFCFSIKSLPKENREFLIQGINAEMSQFKELEEDEIVLDPDKKNEYITNQFIQDLYRFYKLFPRRADFKDLFRWRFDFHNKIALGDILKEDVKVLKNIAEYYFAKDHYTEASEIYNYILEKEKTGELYQKIGYCHQKTGNYEKALKSYLKADLFHINRQWNLKKIALCYRNIKKPGKAIEYYREAEILDPENLNIQLNIGHCLLELKEFDEALKVYFKVEYLAPGNKKVWRPIAWCSFLTGKKDQAEKYYKKLLDDEPGKHDFMNSGHVQWSLGNLKKALELYRMSVSEDAFTVNEFLEIFEEDLPYLLEQGIEEDDVPILLDKLRYDIEG